MTQELMRLIADNHSAFRRGLRQILETVWEFRVVAKSNDGAEVLALDLRPQIPFPDVQTLRPAGVRAIATGQNSTTPTILER